MEKLFLIGNGLDLYFGLPTSFEKDLKPLLKDDIRQALGDCGICWSDFERHLGKLDLTKLCDNKYIESVHKDYLSDPPYIFYKTKDGIICSKVEKADQFNYALLRIPEDLKRSLARMVYNANLIIDEKIEVLKEKCNTYLFTGDYKIITFNYTTTIEKVFNVQESKILHIHGSGKEICFEEDYMRMTENLIIGHGEKKNKYILPNDNFDNYEAKKMFNYYKKNLNIKEMLSFLDRENINKVIVLGHSLAKVDSEYFEKIEELFRPKTWVVSYKETINERLLYNYSFRNKVEWRLFSDLINGIE